MIEITGFVIKITGFVIKITDSSGLEITIGRTQYSIKVHQ